MKNDFVNTRYEAIARELAELEKSRDFDKAMAFAKRELRLVIINNQWKEWDDTDVDFLHWINPYER